MELQKAIYEWVYNSPNVSSLVGKTFTSVALDKANEAITFTESDGTNYSLTHIQDCCESVRIEDVNGDLNDLVGSPILRFEENTNKDNPPEYADSFMWTFYRIETAKGLVVLRWLGESNGYYSESVDLIKH